MFVLSSLHYSLLKDKIMFDMRWPVKIFVANGKVRYGTRVDDGFFPIFSVRTIQDAKRLIESFPWARTDSLTSYAHKLETASACHNKVSKHVTDITQCAEEARNKPNPIVLAIMGANE